MSQADIYTVSRLNSEVRLTLELQFRQLWLVGEVSNFIAASSGHWYFSLKDQAAQVKVAMFKQSNRYASLQPKNGQQILIRARISVYEPRGEYQLLADMLEPAGDGLLKQQYEQIKATLAAEGLLAPERKKPLPKKVQKVGVVTSPTGAAIRDIITVLKRRAPALEVIIYPCLVQGAQAPAQIYNAIQKAITRNEVDVLLIGRGGGSLEDLWCFNDEQVARLIAHCPIPTVSAVGHEIDFTIADFVADVRAPTPSAAAELVSPDQSHLLERISRLRSALIQAQRARMQQVAPKLINLSQRLLALHPKRRLEQQQQRLDELQLRLTASIKRNVLSAQQQQQYLDKSLRQLSPVKMLTQQKQHINQLEQRVKQAQQQQLKQQKQRLAQLSSQLNTVSPLATLARGYSITFDDKQQVVTDSSQLKTGDNVVVKLASGSFDAEVTKLNGAE